MANTKKFAPDVKYVPLIDPLTRPLDEASICWRASTDFPFTLLSSPLSDNDDLDDRIDDRELVRLRFPIISSFSAVSSAITSDLRSEAKSMPLFDRSFGAPCISTFPCKYFVANSYCGNKIIFENNLRLSKRQPNQHL